MLNRLYTPSDENAFYQKVTVTSLVLAKVCFVYEWYTFNQLLTVTFPACFVSSLIGSFVMLTNGSKLKYKPNRWMILVGGIAFLTTGGYYIHVREICGTGNKGGCPFATWFNHNAFMHVALIPILWFLGVGWAGPEEDDVTIKSR